MRPIFHLSIPVRHLQEAVDFYASELGADIGRRTVRCCFGAQITPQNDPSSVTAPMPFKALRSHASMGRVGVRRVSARPKPVGDGEPVTISYEGELTEQGKLMIVDPSDNLIELKAYRHPDEVLGALAE